MSKIDLPLTTIYQQREWKLFSVSWQSADGPFSMYIYAINMEHAVALLEELKETAKVDGLMKG